MTPPFAVAANYRGGWDEARLERWAGELRARLQAPTVTLGLVFISPPFFDVAAEVLEILRVHARIPLLVGCSSQSLIVNGEELEDEPGLVVQLFHLPEARIKAVRLTETDLKNNTCPADWHRFTGLGPADPHGWLVFADPFQLDGETWLREWNAAYPGTPAVGGLASGISGEQRTQIYLNGEVFEHGAVAVSLGGGVKLEGLTSQGCTPIGVPWIITKSERNFIFQIANRPAYHVLVDTFNALSKEEQSRAQGNLFVGFANSEYLAEFQHGDFLVRNLLGADPQNGILAVGALPRTGQTIQFHRRDARSATADLVAGLERLRGRLAGTVVYGGLLCLCNGRGKHLFRETGRTHHDAGLVQELLGPLPVAGFFGNGELGPVGGRNFLHGYTASLALLVKA